MQAKQRGALILQNAMHAYTGNRREHPLEVSHRPQAQVLRLRVLLLLRTDMRLRHSPVARAIHPERLCNLDIHLIGKYPLRAFMRSTQQLGVPAVAAYYQHCIIGVHRVRVAIGRRCSQLDQGIGTLEQLAIL